MSERRNVSGSTRSRWVLNPPGYVAIEIAAMAAAAVFKPLAHLGLADFEARHGEWPEVVVVGLCFVVARWAYIHFFQREQFRSEWDARLKLLREGRGPRRMSLAARASCLLLALALVTAGSIVPGSNGRALLLIGVPMFVLFVVLELNILLRPGETVTPDPNDELLNFFRARTLHVGYLTAIVSLVVLYLVGLFATRYVEALLPLVLAISLLVPAFAYRRLDRRAGADE
jgi:hypothetical protein